MLDFSNMSFDELITPEGYACVCGKHHGTTLKYLRIGAGVVKYLPEAISVIGCVKPFVVFDSNTHAVAGEVVERELTAAGIEHVSYVIPCRGEKLEPGEWEEGSMAMHFEPSCDLILAVGSGVINDLCRVFAYATGLPSACVGTAPSMDGYASNSSSMEINHVKVSLYGNCPSFIICDTEIMSKAPMRMLWAGLGDMLAKYVSICEWRISHIVTGEYYCEAIAELMRSSLRKIVAAAGGLVSRDLDAIKSISEGLVMAGIAMSYAGVSRPASGIEHSFSHMWEMMALDRNRTPDLHGIQVGVGTVLAVKIYDKLRSITPSREHAEAFMRGFSDAEWRANVERVYGHTAGSIFEIEAEEHKNDPATHAKRLDMILGNWNEILAVLDKELPPLNELVSLMRSVGMPVTPSDIGISPQDVSDAFVCSRDIRDKFIASSLIWTLGYTDEFASWLYAL